MRPSSDKPGLLLLERFQESTEALFAAAFTVHRAYAKEFSLDAVAPAIRAIATSGAKGASQELIEHLPGLRIVAIRGIGVDAVALDQARRRGITVTITPNLLTEDVADLAMALLLACARRLCESDRFVREGSWHRGATLPLGRKVSGMRIGILGMGRVGRAIAARVAAFQTRVAYTDLRAMANVDHIFVPTVLELARISDALILAASGGQKSLRIVNGAVLDALGPQGLLINVARGSLVDEAALAAALAEGRLGGAGLDVFADEPNVPRALWNMPQTVLQPHRASATVETRAAMERMVLENLLAHFAGEPVVGAV